MATGEPLFPGQSDIDQLFKIFQRRGTPTAEIWPAVKQLPHCNSEFPQWGEKPIPDDVPAEALGSNNAIDLLGKLLMHTPDKRIACKTAMRHPCFFEQKLRILQIQKN
jgi:cyclin-dependent kinase